MKIRKILFVVMLVAMSNALFSGVAFADGVFTIGSTNYLINSQMKTMDVAPFIENDRSYFPVRYIAEALGISNKNVAWNEATQSVLLTKDNKTVQLMVGSTTLINDDSEIIMDVAPKIYNDRVFLPIRYLAQAFNINIQWNQTGQNITINGNMPYSDQPQKNSHDKLFNLSDDTLIEAINTGKQGYDNLLNFNNRYKLIQTSGNLRLFTPNITIDTPYKMVVHQSFAATIKNDDYTLEKAKRLVDYLASLDSLNFELEVFGTEIDFDHSALEYFYLKQGDKIIQPISKDIIDIGDDGFAERSDSWPYSPAYVRYISVRYPRNEIDFNQNAQFIYSLAPFEPAIFTVNFEVYK